MDKYFCEDSMSPTTVNKIRDYLYSKLKEPILDNRPIIFLWVCGIYGNYTSWC